MGNHNYKELKIWQRSRLLVKSIYLITATFPENEKYGLVSQLQRAAVSVSCNIAEGSGRATNKDFANFLSMAYSSLLEVESLVLLAQDLELVITKNDELLNEITEILKMIYSYRRNILK